MVVEGEERLQQELFVAAARRVAVCSHTERHTETKKEPDRERETRIEPVVIRKRYVMHVHDHPGPARCVSE